MHIPGGIDRRLVALILLGFSSGLPLLLTGGTLLAWLTRAGLSDSDLLLAGLVALPYSFKPLWAPLLDRFALGPLGLRRGWLVATQVALIVLLVVLAGQHPPEGLGVLLTVATLVAIASATQDIAVDAWRLEVLAERERAAGAAASMIGYRVGMVVSGGVALWLVGRGWSWSGVFLIMAVVQGLGLVGTWLAPEPPARSGLPPRLLDLVWLPLVDFVRRLGPSIVAVAAFIVLYKLPDAMTAKLAVPFLLRSGYNEGDVGIWQSSLGMVALAVGMAIGGLAFARLGTNRSLWVFGVLQGASNLSYATLAWWLIDHPPSIPALAATVAVEFVCGGMAVGAFVAYLMGLCTARFAATQYALITALASVGSNIVAVGVSLLKDHWQLSWPMFFVAATVSAIPALILLPWVAPWRTSTIRAD